MVYHTEDQLVLALREATRESGCLAFARKHDISNQFISMVLSGERKVSDRLARALGYERKVVFEKLPTQ